MQLASLPDADPTRPSTPALRMELPFLIGHELVMAQLQISRDGARREVERKRGWTMRFALNFSATGEVGAEVGLLGKAVNVALWAVEPETAEALNEALPELAAALAAIGLDPGAMRITAGRARTRAAAIGPAAGQRHMSDEPKKPQMAIALDYEIGTQAGAGRGRQGPGRDR